LCYANESDFYATRQKRISISVSGAYIHSCFCAADNPHGNYRYDYVAHFRKQNMGLPPTEMVVEADLLPRALPREKKEIGQAEPEPVLRFRREPSGGFRYFFGVWLSEPKH
jgi:hypothetical protein